MPALDPFGRGVQSSAPRAQAEPADHAREKFSAGDEFGRMMERALAPAAGQNAGSRPTLPPQKNSSGNHLPLPTKTRTEPFNYSPDEAHTAMECHAAVTDDKSAGVAKKTSDKTGAGPTEDQPSPTPIPIAIEPPPVFLPLPGAGYFPAIPASGNLVTTSNNGAGENVLPPLAAPGGGTADGQAAVTSGVAAVASSVASEDPSAAGKNAPLKILMAATDARTEAGAAVPPALSVAAVAGKEPAPTPGAAGLNLVLGKEKMAAAQADNAAGKAGMGVALMDSPMKKSENTNKVAGLDVKVLPGGVGELAREKNLPPHLVVAPPTADENRAGDLNATGAAPSPMPTEKMTAVSVVDLPSLADVRMRMLERTQDMVALHSMRLVESKSDSLLVTIKPSVGTELSLELRERNGAIEAHATLQHGDFPLLNQHWSELQQKLEERGIKLAPLGGEANFLAHDQGNARQQAAQEEAASQASAFAEFASVNNAGGASARLARDYDGWESWA